jgi:DNA-binding transcriptional MerR regulator
MDKKVYSIGKVSRLLDVKPHVIRYWEKEIPFIQPVKNRYNGRHEYSEKDIQLLLRLKHLLYEKRFTVEGAREQLFREQAGENQDAKKMETRALLAALRSDLLDVYFATQNAQRNPTANTVN